MPVTDIDEIIAVAGVDGRPIGMIDVDGIIAVARVDDDVIAR